MGANPRVRGGAGRMGQVGDRLDTDVLFGNDNGCKSCLTLSGVTTESKYLDPRSEPPPLSPSLQCSLPSYLPRTGKALACTNVSSAGPGVGGWRERTGTEGADG